MDKILDFISSPILSIDAKSTAEEGAKYMSENNITSLLIKENEDYVGIVTGTDLVKRLVAKGLDPKSTRMFSVMSKPVLTMDHYLPRSEANEFMLRKNIKHLAVTKDGKIIGMLTTNDMISGGRDDSIY
ncbi:MAG: CBS domain-containing protein [Nitrospinae bacterium]|nr:CBS domain-containing protein [Nitrospinota bacterium]MBL7020603.1 CBS domain-containing protein [Nitrospinaceae bacterium]